MGRVGQGLNTILYLVLSLMVAGIIILNLLDVSWISLLISLVVIFLLYICFNKIKNIKRWLTAALLVSFFIRLAFIIAVQTPVESDFAILLEAAQSVTQGDFTCFSTKYFSEWAYQTGFVLYEALILKCTGGSIFALKFMNLLFMAGINILIYLVGKEIFSDKVAFVAAALYAIYPAPVFMASVLTNQHISTFFTFLAVFYLVKEKKGYGLKDYIFAAVFMAVANIMRPEMIVVVVSLLAVTVLKVFGFLSKKEKREALLFVRNITVCMVGYFILTSFASMVISITGVNQNGLSNQVPEWKFTVGLDTDSNGSYNENHLEILDIEDSNQRKEYLYSLLKDYFSKPPSEIINFFGEKTKYMWASNEPTFWSLGHLDGSKEVINGLSVDRLVRWILFVDKGIYIAVWVMFLIFLLSSLLSSWRGQLHTAATFASCIVFTYLVVYLLIEVQTRYRYWLMPLLFILAMGSLPVFQSQWEHLTTKIGHKNRIPNNLEHRKDAEECADVKHFIL